MIGCDEAPIIPVTGDAGASMRAGIEVRSAAPNHFVVK